MKTLSNVKVCSSRNTLELTLGIHEATNVFSISMNFSLCGSAVVLPRRIVPSTEIDEKLGKASGWTESHHGIRHRYWADPNETSSILAAEAARQAAAEANWSLKDIDAIIGACGVMEQPIPGTAILIQEKLGLGRSGIQSFDVNATCLSALLAMHLTITGFATGQWKKVLIVGADIASAALDFSNPEASAIFGDGAFALAIEAGGTSQWEAYRLASYGQGSELCQLAAGGTRVRLHDDLVAFQNQSYFQMNGPGVFKATSRRFPGFLRSLLNRANVELSDVDTIIPHQASAPALEFLKRSLLDSREKVVDIFGDYGNQIAVSIPHALHEARGTGRATSGSRSLLIGSSAGISLGGAVVKW